MLDEKYKLMKNLIILGMVMMGFIALRCNDDDDNSNNQLSARDTDFLQKTGPANQAEIELGQLAASKSPTNGVKAFGQMMSTEHQQAITDLKQVGTSFNASISTNLDAEHQAMKQKLMTMEGYSFDTAYVHGQVRDHQKTLDLFKSEAQNGNAGSLKDYANKYLPHIQMHLNKADSLWNTLKSK